MIRMSFSLLDQWLRGNKEKVIATYLRTPIKMTPAMEEGIAFDKKIKELITRNEPILGLKGLEIPKDTLPNLTLSNSYPGFDIKGELDAYSKQGKTIYEFKCSKIYDSGDYADSYQLPTYFLLCKKNDLPVDRGVIIRFDPVTKLVDYSILYYSERRVSEVETKYKEVAPQIEQFLKDEGIL